MGIEVIYSNKSAPPEIDISGQKRDLFELADKIRNKVSLHLTRPESDPSPYDGFCTELVFRVTADERLSIDLEKTSLVISGQSEAFDKMAKLLASFAEAYDTDMAHIHFDYIDSPYVREDAALVVFTLRVSEKK